MLMFVCLRLATKISDRLYRPSAPTATVGSRPVVTRPFARLEKAVLLRLTTGPAIREDTPDIVKLLPSPTARARPFFFVIGHSAFKKSQLASRAQFLREGPHAGQSPQTAPGLGSLESFSHPGSARQMDQCTGTLTRSPSADRALVSRPARHGPNLFLIFCLRRPGKETHRLVRGGRGI